MVKKRQDALFCTRKCKQISKYHENKAAGKNKSKDNNESKRRFVEAVKSFPCTDCGRSWPPCAMHFDHLDSSSKVDNVANLITSGGWKKLIEEMMKCDLVCACCHAVRTNERGQQHGLANLAGKG